MKSAVAEVSHALSDDTRLAVLRALSKGRLCVGQLCALALGRPSQPMMSHHLACLRRAALVDFVREGKFNYYSRTVLGAELLAAVEKVVKGAEK